VSLFQDPRAQPKLYMMVDMGAGTTEFSVSHLNDQDANHRILCYFDTSILLGGDQFCNNDVKNVGNKKAHSTEEIRLKNRLLKEYGSAWYQAFSKVMHVP